MKYHYSSREYFLHEWNYLVIQESDWNIFDECDSDALPDFVKISYKEWKEIVSLNVEESFPERWYIDVTSENIGVLSKWRRTYQSVAGEQFFNTENGARLYSHDVSGDLSWFDISPLREYSQYVEITFDQFKKFVLKEDEPIPMKVELPIVTHFVKVNGNDLREIFENSNREGKLFLENKFEDFNIFTKEFELSNVDIDFLRGNCNKEIVIKIFGEVIDFDKLQVGSKVELKDGTVGRIVILKSEWFIGNVFVNLHKNVGQCYTTIVIGNNNFRHYHQDKLLKEIKHVIEY